MRPAEQSYPIAATRIVVPRVAERFLVKQDSRHRVGSVLHPNGSYVERRACSLQNTANCCVAQKTATLKVSNAHSDVGGRIFDQLAPLIPG
jgi:hypothetical protein